VRALIAVLAVTLTLAAPGAASAQGEDPNPGAITLTTGLDLPTVYFFRGIRQEADPELTMFPFGDVGISLYSGDGALTSAGVNFGVWNSLHTGSSGLSASPKKRIHYEQDFYASLSLGFNGGVTVTPTFTTYTSPNGSFGTVNEVSLKVAHASRFAPYGLVAFELSGQADAGLEEGVYAELGVGPSWTLGGGPATVAVPVKIGLSLKDYYEGATGDEKFGYIDVGVLFTLPWSALPARFGSWNLHGGVNVMGFGETTKAANNGDAGQVIASVGIGMSY
jgi:hypothetical protein